MEWVVVHVGAAEGRARAKERVSERACDGEQLRDDTHHKEKNGKKLLILANHSFTLDTKWKPLCGRDTVRLEQAVTVLKCLINIHNTDARKVC